MDAMPDIWLLVSDATVVALCVACLILGFGLGWACKSEGELHSIYVADDGKGGMEDVSDRWDPDRPQPGDPTYVPADWSVNA